MEDSVSNQMGKLEERLVLLFRREMAEEQQANSERFEDLSSKLEQALLRISDIERASETSINALSNSLRNEKDKLFAMNNNLFSKIFDLQTRDFETFEKVTNVQEEVRTERVRTDLLQVRIINVEYSEIYEELATNSNRHYCN